MWRIDSLKNPNKASGGVQGVHPRKEGFEPSRLAARDPKSRLSANSSTSPIGRLKWVF